MINMVRYICFCLSPILVLKTLYNLDQVNNKLSNLYYDVKNLLMVKFYNIPCALYCTVKKNSKNNSCKIEFL